MRSVDEATELPIPANLNKFAIRSEAKLVAHKPWKERLGQKSTDFHCNRTQAVRIPKAWAFPEYIKISVLGLNMAKKT